MLLECFGKLDMRKSCRRVDQIRPTALRRLTTEPISNKRFFPWRQILKFSKFFIHDHVLLLVLVYQVLGHQLVHQEPQFCALNSVVSSNPQYIVICAHDQ